MRALGHTLAAEFGNNHGVDVRSYYEVVVGSVRSSLWILLGAVLLVLLIACANVANLLLAAGMARRREFAIRMALGAGRGALARQLTTESLLLAAVGGGLGILLARWMVGVFVVLAGNQLPRATTIAIDGRVLAFTVAISLLVGVFCGVWPLLRLRPRDLTGAVREGDTRTASAGGRRLGNGLVVAEIAIAFALLVGAGLLVKNLLLLTARDAGIRTDRIVSFNVAPRGPRYEAPEQVVAFYHELYARLTAIERVESAGMTSHLPMVGFRVERRVPDRRHRAVDARTRRRSSSTAGCTASISRRLPCRSSRDARSTRAMARDRRQSSSTRRWPTSSGPARIRSASASVRATIARLGTKWWASSATSARSA